MTEEEMVVAVVAITAGTIFAGAVFYKIIDLIKTWVNRKNTAIDEGEFDRLAQAFIKHKKESERRIQQLEAIVADDETIDGPHSKDPSKRISLDKEAKSSTKENHNLRNMLREQTK